LSKSGEPKRTLIPPHTKLKSLLDLHILRAMTPPAATDDCTPEPNSTIERASAALKPSGTRPKPAAAPEGTPKPAAPSTQLSATR
jgi:hypothetical protein